MARGLGAYVTCAQLLPADVMDCYHRLTLLNLTGLLLDSKTLMSPSGTPTCAIPSASDAQQIAENLGIFPWSLLSQACSDHLVRIISTFSSLHTSDSPKSHFCLPSGHETTCM